MLAIMAGAGNGHLEAQASSPDYSVPPVDIPTPPPPPRFLPRRQPGSPRGEGTPSRCAALSPLCLCTRARVTGTDGRPAARDGMQPPPLSTWGMLHSLCILLPRPRRPCLG